MKQISLLFSLLLCSLLSAQNVSFTDPEFKNVLLSASPANVIAKDASGNFVSIDLNSDNEIQISEALLIKYLDIPGNGMITSVAGIKSFTNAEIIKLDFLDWIDSLDLSNMPNLTELSADGNNFLTSVNLSGNTALHTVSLDLADLQILNLSGLSALKNVSVSSSNVSSINLTGVTLLEHLDLANNALTAINLQPHVNLKSVDVSGNMTITSIDASNLLQLQTLLCGFNDINTLNVNNTPQLKLLDASSNALATVNLATSTLLEYLHLSTNNLTAINLQNNTMLEELLISYNYLTLLDLHSNSMLTHTDVEDNDLQTLIIKNGINDVILFDGNPNLTYICTDDSETAAVQATATAQGLTNSVVNSYCTFTPGGTYYTVTGNTKFDADSNGCDAADPSVLHQKFAVNNGTTTNVVIGNVTGNYAAHVLQGAHTISPVLENPGYFNLNPATLSVNFPAQSSPLTQNFCLSANGSHNDLETVIIPLTDSVPGYNATYRILIRNKGTTTQSGTLVFNYEDTLMTLFSTDPVPASQNTGVVTWTFANLAPFETDDAVVTLTLNTPTATPPLNNGDVLNFISQINGAVDETPADNTFALNETVVNSFDPNDKTCLQGSTISLTQVGEYVHYLIRFENTGTANAQNIVIKDEIDTAKLDINSLVALSGSHSFVTKITAPNVVEFIFENIQLPFNDATNDGYVSFKIKTRSTLVTGDSFSNTAKIYFDYNAPIITNTYTTSIPVLATNEVKAEKGIVLYPNPVKDILYFKSADRFVKADIFDAAGRIVGSFGVQNNSVNLSELKKGFYIIRLFTKDYAIAENFIKD